MSPQVREPVVPYLDGAHLSLILVGLHLSVRFQAPYSCSCLCISPALGLECHSFLLLFPPTFHLQSLFLTGYKITAYIFGNLLYLLTRILCSFS